MSHVELLGARRLRALLDEHALRPRKALGQNFVIDPNTIRKVLQVTGDLSGRKVVEVGPGVGSLTLALAGASSRLVAVEVDERLLPPLRSVVGHLGNVEVVHADALAFDFASLDVSRLVGNLPYNIAAPLVLRVLERAEQIDQLVVMSQLEVGERLAARPGSKIYGQTSVLAQYFGEVKVAEKVSRRAFFPEPNVDSVIVKIVRRDPPEVDRDVLFGVVRAAFSQRRKTLRNTVGLHFGSAERAERILREARIALSARPEELDLEAFVALARASTNRSFHNQTPPR